MKRFSAWCVFVATSASAATVLGRPPLIDPPTPPPCAADGICYPNTSEWGFYPARWRTWPGTKLEPTPAKGPTEAGRITEELGPAEPPPMEAEDAAAPPTSARPREKDAKTAPGDKPPVTPPGGESPMPNVPLPDAESVSPLGVTIERDPPPRLPTTLSTTRGRKGTGPAIVAPLNRAVAPQVSTNDPPPAPPWGQSAAL